MKIHENFSLKNHNTFGIDAQAKEFIAVHSVEQLKTVLKENLNIPLDTTLKTNIPIQGHLNVPIKTALQASVEVQNTLPVKIAQGNLKIPLSSLRLSKSQTAASSPIAAE